MAAVLPASSPDSIRSEYRHPLLVRYASREMTSLWSEKVRYSNWRKLWVYLAEAQMELGLPNITKEKLILMKAKIHNIDWDYCAEMESKLRHDVMAHIHTFGKQVPEAMGIIHLGATSCYVTDNGDLMMIKDACKLLQRKLLNLINILKTMALQYKDVPTLGFTHLQPAQLTTVGKRTTLWLQDFLIDYHDLSRLVDEMPCRGVKGTTGTQASFLKLFNGDHEKVCELNKKVTQMMGFNNCIGVSGQTYTRKVDSRIINAVGAIGESAHKMASDIRLLASMKEIEEPFGKHQVGSSAMAYKRNPMRSERVCALSRYLMILPKSMRDTHATQWFERTLDDSAIRRMVIPEAFLAADAILGICSNIIDGIQVWHQVIHKHVMSELPFMATENILMECVQHGGDRQKLHEVIRELSMEAGKVVKVEGKENDLLERIEKDERFKCIHSTLKNIVDPKLYVGRSVEQVVEFIGSDVDPLLQSTKSLWQGMTVADLKV